MTRKATEVFTPGSYPTYTYVDRIERTERTEQSLEQALRDALDTPGQLVSLAGPSKSGKTVLVERVVGRDDLISVSGVGIRSPDDLWEKVLNWMDAPASIAETAGAGHHLEAGLSASGKASLFGLATGGIEADGRVGSQRSSTTAITRLRRGLSQVQHEIANSSYVLLVDDFHYMPRDVQAEVAKAIKEAVRTGIKICTAAVLHRADDVVRANPELRGRVRCVDLKYWDIDELVDIGERGFDELNCTFERADLEVFAREAAGSPQLMQQICLQACFVLNLRKRSLLRKTVTMTVEQRNAIFEQVSSSADFRTLVDILDAGPRTRGTERKIYNFSDGTTGDVYRCVLKAFAADPPRLSFPYDELLLRTQQICATESPVGSSVTGTCLHMSKLAEDKFPNDRVVDWDEQRQVFDIPDPYLSFYLRWSGRLSEDNS